MKTKIGVLAAMTMAVCMLVRPSLFAAGVEVEVGDRPYYTYGPTYWDRGYEYRWGPGHWDDHHKWIHGTYTRHGAFVKEHEKERRHRVKVEVEPNR
jgi:hypothetical protein